MDNGDKDDIWSAASSPSCVFWKLYPWFEKGCKGGLKSKNYRIHNAGFVFQGVS